MKVSICIEGDCLIAYSRHVCSDLCNLHSTSMEVMERMRLVITPHIPGVDLFYNLPACELSSMVEVEELKMSFRVEELVSVHSDNDGLVTLKFESSNSLLCWIDDEQDECISEFPSVAIPYVPLSMYQISFHHTQAIHGRKYYQYT